MGTKTSNSRRLLASAGLAFGLLTVGTILPAEGAEPSHVDKVEAASLDRGAGSLPGSDLPFPAVAAAFLVGSAGLAWVVRRSSPTAA